jgi:hypothetical protein
MKTVLKEGVYGKVLGGPTSGNAIDAGISSIVIEDLEKGTKVLVRRMP